MPRRGAMLLVALLAAAPAARATPADVRVTQEGLAFRVAWTADPADGAYAVEVADEPDFAAGVGHSCTDVGLTPRATALVRCLIPLPAGAWVRVAPLGPAGTPVVVAVPPSAFSFAPAPSPTAAPAAVRNRHAVRCLAATADWSLVDDATTFTGRITSGGAVRTSAELTSPVTGRRPLFGRDALSYALTGADVGRTARCEVTAANGPWTATRADEAVVGHALPAEMRPDLMARELRLPEDFSFDRSVRRPRVRAARARAGALSRATLHAEGLSVFTRHEIDARLTVFRTPAQADAGIAPGPVCRALRRAYRAPSRGVAACGTARVPAARRAVRATTYGLAVRDDGAAVIVVQSVVIASAGNTAFTLDARVGDLLSRRVRALRRADAAAAVAGARLALGAASE